MILVAGGVVFQKGMPLVLPASVKQSDAQELRVADIGMIFSDEQENMFQVIALPVPGSKFAEMDKSIIVDIPERHMDMVVYDTSASSAKEWCKRQLEIERIKAQEAAQEAEEDEENDGYQEGTEQEEQESPPDVSEPELVDQPLAAAPELPAAQVQVPQVIETPQLEVLTPIPLQIPIPGDREG